MMSYTSPIEVILSLLKNKKRSEKGWTARCPVPQHNDKNNSLSLSEDPSHKVLIHCFGGCETKHIMSALGLTLADLYPPKATKKSVKKSLTLQQLAQDKQLSEAFLKELGVSQKGNAVQITYSLEDGSLASRQRLRTSRKAGEGSLWEKGKGNPVLYGLWKLNEARATKTLVFVEGESDCWTLWFHGFSAIGFPGADMTGKLEAQHLKGIETLFILNEKDKGGETFVHGLTNRLKEINWHGNAFIVTLPNEIKDPNDLHKAFPQNFKKHFQKALDQALPLEHSKNSKQTKQFLKENTSLHLLGIGHKSDNLLVPENGWRIPNGWQIDENGIYRLSPSSNGEDKYQHIAFSPVIISARSVNIDSRHEQLEVAFSRDKLLQKIWLNRGDLLNQRSILVLANQGFPVTSRNAGYLVDYLSAFEAVNLSHLPSLHTVSTFGWKRHGSDLFFVLGERPIGTARPIHFLPDGEGERNFAKALKSKGSLEGWLQTIRKILPYPKALFALYAGFAPPLLPLLGFPSFCIDFCGDSSIGKTTVLFFPASIFGDPTGIIPSWNATSVSIERYLSLFNGIPIFLDDSHLAPPEQVQFVIFMISGGIGRLRGALKGSQAFSSWSTVGFFTGERPVINPNSEEGARARVIEFHGSPFPKASGQFVSDLKSDLTLHFGHAGPLFLEHLIHLQQQSHDFKSKTELHNKFLKNLAPTGVDNRRTSYFAAVWTAAEMVEDLFNIGGDPKTLIPQLFQEICGENYSSAQKAMDSICSWVMANQSNFENGTILDQGKRSNSGEVYGLIQTGEYVAIFPHKLEEFLSKKGYSYDAILRTFKTNEWIQTDGNHINVKMSYHGTRSRMVKIFWKHLSL
jgi:uncharacterized protein (DUF927 family)